jgi:hypothetical protein
MDEQYVIHEHGIYMNLSLARLLFPSIVASLLRLFLCVTAWPFLCFFLFFSYSIFFDCWIISARGDEDVGETMDALASTSTTGSL